MRKGHSASLYHNKTEEVSRSYNDIKEIISRYNLLIFGGSNGENYLNDLVIIDIKFNKLLDNLIFEYRTPTVIGDIPAPREVS